MSNTVIPSILALTLALSSTGVSLDQDDTTELASIVAGESIPGNEVAHLWVACTIVGDLERGYSVERLHPGRWNGHKPPRDEHYRAVELALSGACNRVPDCKFLGNARDHDRYWSDVPGTRYRIETERYEMVCVERRKNEQGNDMEESKVAGIR